MRNFMEAYSAVHSTEAREELNSKRDEIAEMDLSMISDVDLEDLSEEVLEELLEEGYTVEECESIFTTVISEAKVTYGHDTESTKAKKTDRLERGLNSAIGKVKMKAAKGAVKAYGAYRDAKASAKMKARRAGQTTKNMSAQAQRKGSEMKAKAKSGLKGMVKRGAMKVARGAVNVAKRMSEGVRDDKTAERKARLEKKRGMKLDDHPQYKEEFVVEKGMNPGFKAYLEKQKKKGGDKEEGDAPKGGGKPDFLDLDKDGNKKESMKKAAHDKKKGMKEGADNVDEMYKGKHGQTEKQYQDSRSDAGKMVSGDSKMSGSAYSSRSMRSTGPNPAGGSKKPAGQGRMTSGARTDLQFRKAELKKKMGESFTEAELDRIMEVVDSWED